LYPRLLRSNEGLEGRDRKTYYWPLCFSGFLLGKHSNSFHLQQAVFSTQTKNETEEPRLQQ